ncbi:condensation domain-containing protein [Umezawaea sp. NPDC059074]|uniref:condensation domain-containing protein n=1 Tax=Umezawaea sp. NPDC059074 TaxID=3346716 RepID=UPI0036B46D28
MPEIDVVDLDWRDATPAQQGIWVLDTDENLRPTYLLPTVLEFTGEVRHDLLVAAARSAVGRHPSLRSLFRLDPETRRVQYHTDGPPGEIGFIDAVADGWSAEELDGLVDVLCWTPFDLGTEAQVRGEVVRVDDTTTLLVLTMHHISVDGWSRNLLVDEVMSTYRCLLDGRVPVLPESPHPDDVITTMSGRELEERVAEAAERLRGAPTVVDLPYDRRPESPSVMGANIGVRLDEDLTAAVLKVAAEEGCSPFMTAVALLAGTLSRTRGQRDVLFQYGWPGREDPATADAIGMFMITCVVRVEFDETTTWRELLGCARIGALESFMDCDVPLDAIATALNPGRQVIWPPMSPVLVNVDELPRELELAPGVTGRHRLSGPVYTKYDLDLFIRVDDDGVTGPRMALSMDYPLDLFDHKTIEDLLAALRQSAHDLAYSAEEPHVRPADH